MKVDPTTKLLDLDPTIFKELENSLQGNNNWKTIADTLEEFGFDCLQYLFFLPIANIIFL